MDRRGSTPDLLFEPVKFVNDRFESMLSGLEVLAVRDAGPETVGMSGLATFNLFEVSVPIEMSSFVTEGSRDDSKICSKADPELLVACELGTGPTGAGLVETLSSATVASAWPC